MITISDEAASAMNRSHRRFIKVESWRGEELLSDDVPVVSASEETDRTLTVPERVTLTVPRTERGDSWSPVAVDHPLAANGQRLRVQLGIGVGNGVVEWMQRGWFVIQDSQVTGDSVAVTAVGMLTLVQEARLVSPYQPSGNITDTIRGLVEPALTVSFDAALTDRAVPSGVNYDEDRLSAVGELLDAWPADAYVTEDGYLSVVPTDQPAVPVLSLTNGAGGTVIRSAGSTTREGAFNVVVARGVTSSGAQIQGVAYDLGDGPKSYDGPYNPLAVPYFYSSPLLTTVAQCNAAAASILARKRRETAQQFTAEIVPDPRLQAGDVVTATTDDVSGLLCSVEALSLPYTAGGGSQSLTLRSLG